MDISNYLRVAKEKSLESKDQKIYLIYNSYGDWAYIDTVPVEDSETGFEIINTFLNGEEI